MEYNRGIVLKCFRRGDTEIMKKLISVLLASAMVLSMASCTSKKPSGHRDIEVVDGTKRELGGTEETYPVIVEPTETEAPSETTEETTAETTEATTEATTSATAPAAGFGTAEDYVQDIRDTYKYLEIDGEYHVPAVIFDTPYAEEMRQEIHDLFSEYAFEISSVGNSHYWYTKYIAFLTDDGILTVVFVEGGEWDDDIYHIWNFDVTTGDKVDNKKLARLAGISDIRTAAMDGAQAYYNNTGMMTVENYEVVSTAFDYMYEPVSNSFSEENINENMPLGLMDDGTMFFISPLASFGGAEWYYRMYDVNGTNLEYDEGWVGSPH